MSTERGKGYLPDEPSLVVAEFATKHVGRLVGAVRAPAAGIVTADLYQWLAPISDQGATSSCVGQSFAGAIMTNAGRAGHPIPRPSAKALYDFGRMEDARYEDLVDEGSRPLAVVKCAREKGLVADKDWPLTAKNVNEKPPLDVYENALGAKLGDHYRIPAGPGAAGLVAAAIVAGYAVVFAMPVDEAYEGLGSWDIYPGRKGNIIGGHAQYIFGFDTASLWVAGSWSREFGKDGCVRIDREYIESGECTDFIVPKTTPTRLVNI